MGPVTQNLTYVMEGNYGLMLSKMIQKQQNQSWRIFIYDIIEGGKRLKDIGVIFQYLVRIWVRSHKNQHT